MKKPEFETFPRLLSAFLLDNGFINAESDDIPEDEITAVSAEICDGEQIYEITVKSAWGDSPEKITVSITQIILYLANSK